MALFQPATTLQPYLDAKAYVVGEEKYVTHIECTDDGGKGVYLVLTTDNFRKIDVGTRKQVSSMSHSVVFEMHCGEGELRLVHTTGDKKSSGNMVKKTIKDAFKSSTFTTEDKKQMEVFNVACECMCRRFWQTHFEQTIVEQPDLYQYHMFLTKYDKKGKPKYRCLVLSSSCLYLIVPCSTTSNNFILKWAVRLECIEFVSRHEDFPAIFTVYLTAGSPSTKGSRQAPLRSKIVFQARTPRQRQRFIRDLCRVYFLWNDSRLVDREVKGGKKKASLKSITKIDTK